MATSHNWLEREPTLDDMRREARIANRKARRWLALGLTLLVTFVIVGWKSRQKPQYTASVVLSFIERDFDDRVAPPTQRAITDYMWSIALNRGVLRAVIDEHGLYPERSFDPHWQIESMRDDIDLELVSNYFSPESYIESTVRSARVVLRFRARDPERATIVARQLGRLVGEDQNTQREKLSSLTAAAGRDAIDALQLRITSHKKEAALLQLGGGLTPGELVRLRRLTQDIDDLEQQMLALQRGTTALSLRGALERESLGMRFEVLDESRPEKPWLT
ncbi:MAG: hypothetical protein AAGA56_20885, partial [Myxococcota bacterium]